MTAELRHRYLDVDGVRLHWAELGQDDQDGEEDGDQADAKAGKHPPLVLLHGIMDSHLTWRASAELLACDRRVLMPDLPGCGLSARPNASYALQWHAGVIAKWLELLDLSQVDVVGHSFGGGVAQMLLLACPERVRRIVLVAAGGLGRDVGFWLKFATFPHFVEHYGQPFMAFGTRRALGHALDALGRADVEALSVMNSQRGTARAFSRTVRDVIDFQGQTRLFLQRAHEVAFFPPIAVLWGERDNSIPIEHGRAFAMRMEGARFAAFAGCGHYLHQEDVTGFVRAVREFLADPAATPVRFVAEPITSTPKRSLRAAFDGFSERVSKGVPERVRKRAARAQRDAIAALSSAAVWKR
jgi:pimeloyl-ACP methyl ester carboxylesterase